MSVDCLSVCVCRSVCVSVGDLSVDRSVCVPVGDLAVSVGDLSVCVCR